MTTMQEVQLGQRFSFEVYPLAVLGNSFKNVRLEGILNARLAANSGYDIVSLHAQVYPTLPEGTTPNDPYQYNYAHIRHESGEYAIIGIPWIRQDTIEITTGGRVTLVFEDKTPEDVNRMLLALSSNGYRPDSINVVDA